VSTNTAQTVSSFLDSIGINVHMAYTWTSYNNVSLVENDLSYIGVTNLRDKLLDWSDVQGNYAALASDGYKFDFSIPVYSPTTVNLNEFVTMVHDFVVAHPGSVTAIEGANEVNIWAADFNGGTTLPDQAALQRALYDMVKADPTLANLPVFNLTMAYTDASQNRQLGDLSDAANYANEHAYAWDWGTPAQALPYLIGFAQINAPGLPVVITETGYNTDITDGYSGVDQLVQAKMELDTLVDAYNMGVSQTYLYELLDEPGSSWGIFNADGTPKLAAIALHNFTTILNDPHASLTPHTNTLDYTISNMPSSGNQLLLEKGNGTFDLVVWSEAQIWDPNTQQEVAAPDHIVTVNFGHVEGTVLVYDPLVGTSPIATYTNVSQIQLDLNDHPLIIEVPGVTLSTPTVASFSPVNGSVGTNGEVTNANHLILTGTAAAGNTIDVFDGSTEIGSAVANSNGAWTFATGALANGSHSFTSEAVDQSGQTSAHSTALNVSVDTILPSAPSISSMSTVRNTDLLSGTAEAGSAVKIYDGTTLLGQATANAHGVWDFNSGALSAGTHNFTATATDTAGNVSATSNMAQSILGVIVQGGVHLPTSTPSPGTPAPVVSQAPAPTVSPSSNHDGFAFNFSGAPSQSAGFDSLMSGFGTMSPAAHSLLSEAAMGSDAGFEAAMLHVISNAIDHSHFLLH